MSARTPFLALLALFLAEPSLSAQEEGFPPTRAQVGLNFIASEPVGDFEHFVGSGAGGDFFGRVPMDPRGVLSLRGDLGFLIYGYESKSVCFQGVGCRINADLQTTNGIFFGGIGPELALPMKGFRPYVHALMGASYFSTSSSLDDDWGYESSYLTENFGDWTMSWGVGGGLEMNLRSGATPVDLNLGIRYLENGVVEYLTEGDIVDNPDGSITLYPVRSEANLMSFHIGITVGIPRGGDHYR